MRDHRKRVGQRFSVSHLLQGNDGNDSQSQVLLYPSSTVPLRLISWEFSGALRAGTVFEGSLTMNILIYAALQTAPGSPSAQITPQPLDPSGPAATFTAWWPASGVGLGTAKEYFVQARVPFDQPFEFVLPIEREIIFPAGGFGYFHYSHEYIFNLNGGYHGLSSTVIVEELN